jgi:ribosomal protein S18 acetylase RimI-like enzyme
MKEKIIARYFFTPFCPESYATEEKLRIFFEKISEIHFETFNCEEGNYFSKYNFFELEKKLIDTFYRKNDEPLLFGKLFINGQLIPGFPPSSKHLKNILVDNKVNFDESKYIFDYSSKIEKANIIFDKKNLIIKKVEEEEIKDVSKLCTLFHPYLNQKDYKKEYWGKFENRKNDFLRKSILNKNALAFLAYFQNEPVGFIEAYSLEKSVKYGFPVHLEENVLLKDSFMIVCLSIRKEFEGNNIASRLLEKFISFSSENKIKNLQVLSFPQNFNWHPENIYKKYGFKEVKVINKLKLLSLNIMDFAL